MKSNKTIIGLLIGLIVAVLIGAVVWNGFSPAFQIPVLHQTEQMVFAHRGGLSLGPENTLHTFQKALAYGAHVLELDVRLTRDGHLVVIHDATVDRTTDGTGAVGNLSLEDIGRLDAAFDYSADGGRTYPLRNTGVTIPRLAEVFQRFPNIPINIELKDDSLVAAETLCRLVTEYDVTRKIIVASFHSRVTRHFRSICPDTPTAATAGEVWWFALLSRLRLENLYRPHAAMLQVPKEVYGFRLVTQRFVDAAHNRGLKVHVWVVNHPGEKQKFLDMGVDGIITDFPGSPFTDAQGKRFASYSMACTGSRRSLSMVSSGVLPPEPAVNAWE
jgi:glycerophosphoryl diester phosphodiesterase